MWTSPSRDLIHHVEDIILGGAQAVRLQHRPHPLQRREGRLSSGRCGLLCRKWSVALIGGMDNRKPEGQ
jgi:hypothetical protein